MTGRTYNASSKVTDLRQLGVRVIETPSGDVPAVKPHYKLCLDGTVQVRGVHPEMIKAAMRMRGVTSAAFAEQIGASCSAVHQVIFGTLKSARIQKQIAELIGLPVDLIWPHHEARPVLRIRDFKGAAA